MHMAAMLDYECLNCCWVNARILDETIVVENMGGGLLNQVSILKNCYGEFVIYLIPYMAALLVFRFLVVDGSISLSYLRSLLLKMWE